MNENDKSKLNSAFGDIDEKYISDAAAPIKASRRVIMTRLIAACAALVIVALPLSYMLIQNNWRAPTPVPPMGNTPGIGPQGPAPETTNPSTPVGTDPSPDPIESTTPSEPIGTETAPVPVESTTPSEPVGTETAPVPTGSMPGAYNPYPPEPYAPTVTVNSGNTTANALGFFCNLKAKQIWTPSGIRQEIEMDGVGPVEGIKQEYNNIETLIFDPNGISVSVSGVSDYTIKNYIAYKIENDSSEAPVFDALELEITDLSQLGEHPGDYYVAITLDYSDAYDGWFVDATYSFVVKLCVPEKNNITVIPGGSLYEDLNISAGGNTYTAKSYMVFVEEYDEMYGGWLTGDGISFEDGFSMNSEGIPEFEFSPDISVTLPKNATLNSITIWSGAPQSSSTQRISLNKINEISSYPGTWYAEFTVTYTGDYVSAPDQAGYERVCHDYVVKINVTPLHRTVTINNGYQKTITKSFVVSSATYDSAADSFLFADGIGVDGRLPEVAHTLNLFSITNGMEIGLDLPSNAQLNSITVYDSEFNVHPISKEIGTNFTAISDLPAGEYYVALQVYSSGYYYPAHNLTESAYCDEVFKLVVCDTDALPIPQRFINPTEVEHISFVRHLAGGDNSALYYIDASKKNEIINILHNLEFKSAEPINSNEFIPPDGGDVVDITVCTKDGDELVFHLIAGCWLEFDGSDMIYELKGNYMTRLYTASYDMDPDRIDMLPEGLKILKVESTSNGFTKITENPETVEKLYTVLNSLSFSGIIPRDQISGSLWNIHSDDGTKILFCNYNYICVNDVWYIITDESAAALKEAINSLVSDHAVTDYSLDEALELLKYSRHWATRQSISELFGPSVDGIHYEFNDGRCVQMQYESDGTLNEIHYSTDWCGALYGYYTGGK